MTKDEALELALEAQSYAAACLLNQLSTKDKHAYAVEKLSVSTAAIKEALAQPEQEPAFWLNEQGQLYATKGDTERHSIGQKIIPLYTTPPQRKTFNHDEFVYWWFEYGSGLFPLEGEDQEEHAYRVATAAWQAAHGIKEKNK